MAIYMEITMLEVYDDSKIIINQLLTEHEVRKDDLVPYFRLATQHLQKFEAVMLEHVLRKGNRFHTEEWRQPLFDYLEQGKLPEDPRHCPKMCRRAPYVLYYKETLYRRSFEKICLRCLGEEEANQAMEEAHLGVCRAHQSGPNLHFQLKRVGYYWLSMVKDWLEYAKRCQACQFHANFIHQPPKPLHPTVASWSFDAWRLDVVGPITPKSYAREAYILVVTDYFSSGKKSYP